METGILTQVMHKQIRQTHLKTWVFATSNGAKRFSEPLLSRFRVMYLNQYGFAQSNEKAFLLRQRILEILKSGTRICSILVNIFTNNKMRIMIIRYVLIGWGIINIPLNIYTGLGLALPSNLPALQFEVSSIYEKMLAALYIPLAICSILAAFDPVRHKLLIIFIVVSSFAHATVMTFDALTTHVHLWSGMTWGSVSLYATGIVFIIFYPRGILEKKMEK
jgi:hypothetical protein